MKGHAIMLQDGQTRHACFLSPKEVTASEYVDDTLEQKQMFVYISYFKNDIGDPAELGLKACSFV